MVKMDLNISCLLNLFFFKCVIYSELPQKITHPKSGRYY